jgi:hypothetical protein
MLLLRIVGLAVASMFWPLLLAVVVIALQSERPLRVLLAFYLGGFLTATVRSGRLPPAPAASQYRRLNERGAESPDWRRGAGISSRVASVLRSPPRGHPDSPRSAGVSLKGALLELRTRPRCERGARGDRSEKPLLRGGDSRITGCVEQSHDSCESAFFVKGAHIFGIVETPALVALFARGIPGTDRDGPWVR